MACYSPFKAYRLPNGTVKFGYGPDAGGFHPLRIPCGGCIGCRESIARDWALRAYLELWDHLSATFVTLTYHPDFVPVTLQKRHPVLYMKRLRAEGLKVRVFGCAEYGSRGTKRPHYHLVLFGAHPVKDRDLLTSAWATNGKRFHGGATSLGFVDIDTVTPRVLSYVSGYVSKKLIQTPRYEEELLDRETGELYTFQPPYRICSRNPGLGGNARLKWTAWRDTAILGGVAFPPPRYLHQAWQKSADSSAVEKLEFEKRARFRIRPQCELDRLRADAFNRLALKEQRRQKL